MQIIHSLNNPDNLPLALTIGNFDGVHIGHQAILNTLVQTAKQQQYQPAVMTFTPHAKVFFGKSTDFLISSDEEKADWMARHEVATLLQIPFNHAFSKIDAVDFIDLLIHQLHVNYLLIGDDFRFGYQGRGSFELLSRMCAAQHISLQHTPTILYDGQRVSSSRVRQAIKAADFDLVEHLMGRRLQYNGKVIRGKQLGRTIDFPTANIYLPQTRLLPDGVFAVRVYIEDGSICYHGMCNIGTKPTVDNSQRRQIETHIFDFSDDLYSKTITIEPVEKIRDEVKFNGMDALIKQLHDDKITALAVFKSISNTTPVK
ncbi:MAG: riboflavin biosynthesis protein RibF [Gammaproteobacteria bacterium]|nr:MAG: riboflavin biosynthesis protein RibF [Gammaproteobacteria bacterium]